MRSLADVLGLKTETKIKTKTKQIKEIYNMSKAHNFHTVQQVVF